MPTPPTRRPVAPDPLPEAAAPPAPATSSAQAALPGASWSPAEQRQAPNVGELGRHPFTLLVHPDEWELRRAAGEWVLVPRVSRLDHQAGVSGVDTVAALGADGQQVQRADPAPAIVARQRRGYVPLPLDAGLAPGESYVRSFKGSRGETLGYSDPWSRSGIGGRTVRDEVAYCAWATSLVGRFVAPPTRQHVDLLFADAARRHTQHVANGRHPQHVEAYAGQLAALRSLLEPAHG